MTDRMESSPVEVVVVGSGVAGLTAAIHADREGCRVTLLTKTSLTESNTRYAQGGIAGVMFPEDDVSDHLHDTIVAGAGLVDPEAARVLVTEGPERIHELIEAGVAFDRDADGALRRGLEAAHSFPRVLHAGGDATGAAIEATLVASVRASGVRIVENAFLVDLLMADGSVTGVEVLVDTTRRRIPADAVVLATGGAGQLFSHTTNPAVATADGIAAALRAGAVVRDLEFVQFHPTVMPAIPATEADVASAAFLVSEAVRGEGAVLRNARGERFMTAVHSGAELAPRDVVARAIAVEMSRQGGSPVLLDATSILGIDDTSGPAGSDAVHEQMASFLSSRFPTIDAAVRARGFDWAREAIPVTPAAHYLMGGVDTDLDGRTSLRGLYAAGETARTGVHGANRLASNSLLEGAVFGARVAQAIRTDAVSGRWRADDGVSPTAPPPFLAPDSSERPFSRQALQDLLWAEAGLVRDAEGLRRAAITLETWAATPRDEETVGAGEDANLLLVARHLVAAALARPVSVGAHFRSDSPADGAHTGADALPLRAGRAPLPVDRFAKVPA